MTAKVAKSTKSTKNVSNVAPVVTESTTPATVASVNPVPSSVSAPPAGWVAPAKLGRKGRRPKNGLPLVAPELADELRKNASAILQELGPKAADPALVASALDSAHAWDGADAKASTFHTYTRSQRGASWDAAIALMGALKAGVRYAVARDATFADRFPTVAKAFAPTRRSKKATAGDAEAAAPAPAKPAIVTA